LDFDERVTVDWKLLTSLVENTPMVKFRQGNRGRDADSPGFTQEQNFAAAIVAMFSSWGRHQRLTLSTSAISARRADGKDQGPRRSQAAITACRRAATLSITEGRQRISAHS